MHKRQQMAT